jgi:hypothetical protein
VNGDLKVKLDKKEKEVRRFMAEMNKILLHYDETDGDPKKKPKRSIKIHKYAVSDIEIGDSEYYNAGVSGR